MIKVEGKTKWACEDDKIIYQKSFLGKANQEI